MENLPQNKLFLVLRALNTHQEVLLCMYCTYICIIPHKYVVSLSALFVINLK